MIADETAADADDDDYDSDSEEDPESVQGDADVDLDSIESWHTLRAKTKQQLPEVT